MNEFYNSFTREKTDIQYNPTLWTQRLPADELLPFHVDLTKNKSEHYRNKVVNCLTTLEYGDSEYSGSIDVFCPENVKSDAPIVVYIHGGWWQWFSKEQFSFLAEPFNNQGMAVYMPGYRMAPDWENEKPMESILTQMQYAIALVLKKALEKKASAVYLVGHSAGGQLVSMLHKTDWGKFNVDPEAQKKLKAIFSLAGLFDIRPLVDSFVNDEINMSIDSAAAVSPQMLPTSIFGQHCPLHLILPEFDTPEFFRQTKEYQNKLLKEGGYCYLHVAKNRDHLDIIEKLPEENDELITYLLNHMK